MKLRPDQLDKAAQRAREVPLELMRFLPLLQEIMSDLVTGRLGTGIERGHQYISKTAL